MPSALWWKKFYESERISLGESALEAMVASAPSLNRSRNSTIIFPHTRLAASGHLTAAAARSIVESGCDTVLAIGVLHGGRESDAEIVARARAGDAGAIKALRGIHGPGAPLDVGIWKEEFSLDNFEVMLHTSARLLGTSVPQLIKRYPFLTGEHPESLRGFEELQELISHGARLVGTADMIHHGAGYGWPRDEWRTQDDPDTIICARDTIEESMVKLATNDFVGFLLDCAAMRSDFRDGGPVIAALRGDSQSIVTHDLTLVDYADVLEAKHPTWVAAALLSITS